jgi:Flp pilus assembly protein TadD
MSQPVIFDARPVCSPVGSDQVRLYNHCYPVSPLRRQVGDEAASWARKAALEKPDWAVLRRVEAIAYATSGRIVEAREALARVLAIDPICS